MAALRFLEPELQKQGMWVGLIREGFLEEGNQDPDDGDGHGGCGSGLVAASVGTLTLRLRVCGLPFQ